MHCWTERLYRQDSRFDQETMASHSCGSGASQRDFADNDIEGELYINL